MYEAGMANPYLESPITPIIGKLRLHIQDMVDHEDFYIMPLSGCDVLLGMPWLHKVRAMVDVYGPKDYGHS